MSLVCPPAYVKQVIVGERHLVENNQTMGAVKNLMNVNHITREGEHMNILEGFHTYIETKNDTLMTNVHFE